MPNRLAIDQISGYSWQPSSCQILSGGQHRAPRHGQFARHDAGVDQCADSQRDVDTFRNQVDRAVISAALQRIAFGHRNHAPRHRRTDSLRRCPKLVELYKSLQNDLPAFNGDPSWTLPMPARYVIAPDCTIVYAEVNPDYTHRPDPVEMLPAIRQAAIHAT